MPHRKYQLIMSDQFVLHRQCKPIMPHIVYNNIKEGGRYETSLGCPPSPLEVGAVVPVFSGNDLLPLSKLFQETAHACPSAISPQGCQETALVHSVIGFGEVQKNQ